MPKPDWQRVRALFDAVVDLDSSSRGAFLDAECGDDADLRRRVEDLLAADDVTQETDLAIERPISPEEVGTDLTQVIAGTRIGSYRIEQLLGTGGMSTVFLAVQENPHRKVALKTMLLGMLGTGARRRFEYESEILGRLHHPAIAQIYEAGTWQEPLAGKEVPFFAMEHVADARPFNRYVREEKLDLHRALGLFLEVCDAVHYGHQFGVIHRDLKPANVLVDGHGRPKIIDFGIARATDRDMREVSLQTQTGHVLGTLQYMPPEQLDSTPDQIDLRVDVYALGVMLYEMLAGRPPFDPADQPITMFAKAVREGEPMLPSRCASGMELVGLARELDWISRQAIRPDKTDRYQSVAEFAADLRRFLADEPVSVGPPSTSYYVRKFVRRNRALVSGMVAVAAVLILGIATTTWWWLRADEEKKAAQEQEKRATEAAAAAERQARKASTINQFFNELLKFADPAEGRYQSRPDWTIREALDAFSEMWFDQLAKDPDVESHVRLSMGNAYRSFEEFDKAEKHLTRAVELRREHLPVGDPDLADAILSLAGVKGNKGHAAESVALYREALAGFRAAYGDEHQKVALCYLNIGVSLTERSQLPAREDAIRRALEIYRRLPGNNDRFIASCLPHLGTVAYHKGDIDAAIALYREGLAMYEKAGQGRHPHAAATHGVLAQILDLKKGDRTGAIAHLKMAIEINTQAFGSNGKATGRSHHKLATVLGKAFRYGDAERHLREADRILAGAFPGGSWDTVAVRRALAANLRGRQRPADALVFAQKGFDEASKLGTRESRELFSIATELGRCLRACGELDAAEKLIREQLAITTKHGVAIEALVLKSDLATVLTMSGRLAEAGGLFDEILPASRKALPANHVVHGVFRLAHGKYRCRAKDYAAAEKELVSALKLFEQKLGKGHMNVRHAVHALRTLYAEWGKKAEQEHYQNRLEKDN